VLASPADAAPDPQPLPADVPPRPAFAPAGLTDAEKLQARLRDECFEVAETLHADFPAAPAGWTLLGAVHRYFGNDDGADKLLKRALVLAPEFPDAHRQLDVVRENNLAHKERTEKVIPVEKVRDLIQGNLQMARHLLENLPEVMATRIESPQDVAAITRIEVNAILRELAASSSSVTWMNPTPPAQDDIASAD
jgi:hypothetical protein